MKKRKFPVLTSPWKIGLLVSLLLVLLCAGVNYLLMRAFNFSWSWYSFTDGRWLFHRDAFLNQMLPQIGFTLLLSIIAFVVIKAAVQKYKAFLDSGTDYRNLIESVKGIHDLDDPEFSGKIDAYPGLKHFFDTIKDQIAGKEQALNAREREICEAREAFDQKCDAFVQKLKEEPIADIGLTDGMKEEFPRLAEVAGVILEQANQNGFAQNNINQTELGRYGEDLKGARNHLLQEFQTISTEFLECSQNAKEIEAQLGELKTQEYLKGEDETGSREEEAAKIRNSLRSIDELSESLDELGEGTKRVAISTALQAGSGEGSLEDLIQLAENVKEVAGNFDKIADSYRKLTSELEESVDAFSSGAMGMAISNKSELVSSFQSLSSKVSLWSERVVVLAEKLNTFETSCDRSFDSLNKKIREYTGDTHTEEESVVDNAVTPDEASMAVGEDFMELEQQEAPSSILTEDPSDMPISDQLESVDGIGEVADPELPSQQSYYKDDAGEMQMGGFFEEEHPEEILEKDTEDNLFMDMPSDHAPEKVEETDPLSTTSDEISAKAVPGTMDYNSVELELDGIKSSPPADEAIVKTGEDLPGGMEDAEDAVDLYALGAVDYQPKHSEKGF